MNYTFTKDGSDFDGIPTNYKYYTLTQPTNKGERIEHDLYQNPWKQFWDGLTAEEKEGKVLVVPKYKREKNGNIDYQNYENLVIEKKDKYGNGIDGIQFCIAKDPNNSKQVCNENYPYERWITKDGRLKIPTNELPLYNQTLIETGETAKNHKPKKIDLYVDPGNRFLGEVPGWRFISNKTLIDILTGEMYPWRLEYKDGISTKIGNILRFGRDTDQWLKIYDARKGTILYIAKKPLTNSVSWDMLYQAGVVFGPEFINTRDGDPNLGKIKTKEELGEEIYNNFKALEEKKMNETINGNSKYGEYKAKIIEINGKRYIVRLLRASNRKDPNATEDKDYYTKKRFIGSEWNRYILPLVKDYRYYINYSDDIEQELKVGEDGFDFAIKGIDENSCGDFKIQLATYNWFGDLTQGSYAKYYYDGTPYYHRLSKGQKSWTEEYAKDSNFRGTRGSKHINYPAASTGGTEPDYAWDDFGFRPVLEEIE